MKNDYPIVYRFVVVMVMLACVTMMSAQQDSVTVGGAGSLPAVDYADSSSRVYIVRGSDSLRFDYYVPRVLRPDSATVVYLYGGGFINGERYDRQTRLDADALLRSGYRVVTIDYRKFFATIDFDTIPRRRLLDMFDSAVAQAASDCAAAVAYVVHHAAEMEVDTSRIILCGSSAGAIAVLQLDFERVNGMASARDLPEGFRPAAVVAYAGAVFNHHGSLEYGREPAPTAFFYGENDRVVPYRCLRLFAAHYGGSDCLIDRFADNDYVYWAFRYRGHGHEVSAYLYRTMAEFNAFVDAVMAGRRVHYDTRCSVDDLKITQASNYSLIELIRTTTKQGLFDE